MYNKKKSKKNVFRNDVGLGFTMSYQRCKQWSKSKDLSRKGILLADKSWMNT